MKWNFFQWFWISIKQCAIVCCGNVPLNSAQYNRSENEAVEMKNYFRSCNFPRTPVNEAFTAKKIVVTQTISSHFYSRSTGEQWVFHWRCCYVSKRGSGEANWKGYFVDVNNLIKIIHLSGQMAGIILVRKTAFDGSGVTRMVWSGNRGLEYLFMFLLQKHILTISPVGPLLIPSTLERSLSVW